jgi:hypothetical protein
MAEQTKKYIIGRPVNGITINGREYVRNDKDELMLFDSENEAKAFLAKHGVTDLESQGIEILLDEDDD